MVVNQKGNSGYLFYLSEKAEKQNMMGIIESNENLSFKLSYNGIEIKFDSKFVKKSLKKVKLIHEEKDQSKNIEVFSFSYYIKGELCTFIELKIIADYKFEYVYMNSIISDSELDWSSHQLNIDDKEHFVLYGDCAMAISDINDDISELMNKYNYISSIIF